MAQNKSTASPPSDQQIVQPLCAVFRRFLKRQGLKFTTERAIILDTVMAKDGVFEVDELVHEMYQAGHRVSRATAYRTIKHLVESGIIEQVLLDSRQSHYQLTYGREHADHLINVDDGNVIEFHSAELDELRDRICREHGLDPVSHRLVIFASEPTDAETEEAEGR
jgi:Fur family ferric uptake transcriptional regulator